jgi:pilus assembly protein FimV
VRVVLVERSPLPACRRLKKIWFLRDKALREANTRLAELEKSIKELQRLVELKSQGMAQAQSDAPRVDAGCRLRPSPRCRRRLPPPAAGGGFPRRPSLLPKSSRHRSPSPSLSRLSP